MPQPGFAFFAPLRLGVRLCNPVMTENGIAKEIVDAAFRIHTTLGPGLLESVYDAVLAHELGRRGLRTARQQPIPVIYDNVRIDIGFRADLIVEDKVIVEIKSVEVLAPVHKKQLLTYLRLADKRLGLLINFHVAFIKEGIARVVNGLEDETHAKPPRRLVHKRELSLLLISGDIGAFGPELGRGDIGKQCRIVIVSALTITSFTSKRTIFCRSSISIISARARKRA